MTGHMISFGIASIAVLRVFQLIPVCCPCGVLHAIEANL